MLIRLLFLLILLAGAGVGFAYPWASQNFERREIGNWRAQDAATGFQPVEVRLDPADAPVGVVLDVSAVVPPALAAGQSVVTVTAATQGRTVLARSLDVTAAEKRDDSPQTPQQIYRIEAGAIPEVEAGSYTFTVGPGDAEGVDLLSVDLSLVGGNTYDERAQPIGFSIMAIGFIGFVLTFRRRDGGNGGGSTGGGSGQPPKPRWGRDAAGA